MSGDPKDTDPGASPQPQTIGGNEVDDSKEARLQAEADAIDRALAYRRPPVEYQQGASSSGEDGLRYYAEHAPSQATDHATDPDGLVIVASTTNPGVAPPAQPPELDPTRTAPMLFAPPRGPNSTDPIWPPSPRADNDTPPMGPAAVALGGAVPESAAPLLGMSLPAPRSRPNIDRSKEITVDTYRPTIWEKHKKIILGIAGGCVVAAVVLFGILAAMGDFGDNKDRRAPSLATSAPVVQASTTPLVSSVATSPPPPNTAPVASSPPAVGASALPVQVSPPAATASSHPSWPGPRASAVPARPTQPTKPPQHGDEPEEIYR